MLNAVYEHQLSKLRLVFEYCTTYVEIIEANNAKLLALGWLSTPAGRPGAGAAVGLNVSALYGVLREC